MDGGPDAVTQAAERTAFVRSIADDWDDPMPILVYSDWLEERGEETGRFLRWYAHDVVPAIVAASRPIDDDEAFLGPVYEWRKVQRRRRRQIAGHSNATSLFRFGALAMCSLERKRNALPVTCIELISEFRLFALGLATDERLKALRAREREIVQRICFGRYSPKAVDTVSSSDCLDTAEVRLYALDAANPRANPTSIPQPYSTVPLETVAFGGPNPLLFWGALHRTLAYVDPGPGPDP